MKLTIDRSRWLRGEGSVVSRLLRPADGKMCCLGFYGLAMGANPDALLDVTAPQVARDLAPFAALIEHDERAACWPTVTCGNLMCDNDDEHTTAEDREARLTKYFAEIGVEVEFVDAVLAERSDATPAGDPS